RRSRSALQLNQRNEILLEYFGVSRLDINKTSLLADIIQRCFLSERVCLPDNVKIALGLATNAVAINRKRLPGPLEARVSRSDFVVHDKLGEFAMVARCFGRSDGRFDIAFIPVSYWKR